MLIVSALRGRFRGSVTAFSVLMEPLMKLQRLGSFLWQRIKRKLKFNLYYIPETGHSCNLCRLRYM